jgi:hypothetical protein
MRQRFLDDFHYALLEDEATGALYLQAICNRSAAYFTVETKLLPDEAAVVLAHGHVTEAGKALLGKLADQAQWSVEDFKKARDQAWQAVGLPAAPPVPPLG